MRKSKMIRWVLFIAVALTAIVLPGRAADAAERAAWELSPYRVQLFVAVETGPGLPPQTEQDLIAQLAARIRAAVGGTWQLAVAAAPDELRGKLTKSLASIAEQDLPADALNHDKVMLLGVTSTPVGPRVQARELDVATHLWNGIVSRECQTATALPRAAADAVQAAFAPVARIDSADGNNARLRLKASALRRRDAQSPVDPGTVFRPALVKSDTSGKLTGAAQIVPWTYMVPTGATGGRVNCRVVTGLDSAPIPDYHPHRQRLALGVAASSAATKLTIVTNDEAAAPQEGYEVVEEATDENGKTERVARIGSSGADGVVVVPPGGQTVRMLVVLHGDITLARLPLVPGLAPEVTLPLPPAGRRVAIAAALSSLEDDLVDRLARQQVLEQRIVAAADDTAAADKLRGQLRNLPGAEAFAARLAEQETAVGAADATAQQLLAPKIAALKKVIETLP
jgi:hypothetical protein